MQEKLCAFCNQPFVPRSSYQRYCKSPHYMNCPVCGKQYLVTNNENLKRPPVACSYACRRAKADLTCLEKYGNKCAANGEEQKKMAEETMMEKYGVRYTFQSEELTQKGKETMMEKYGADHPMHVEEIKEKVKETNMQKFGSVTYLISEQGKKEYEEKMMEKYGVLHPIQNNEIKEKIKNTSKQRYGSEWFSASKEGKSKIQQSVKQKYGVNYVTQLESTKKKSRETFIKNYGVDNPSKSDIVKKKIKETIRNRYGVNGIMDVPEIREKIMETSLERYGVPFYIMKPEVKISSGSISKFNLAFADKLSERNIEFEMEKRIKSRSYDFYIPRKNMLLELNPSYTHNLIGNHWSKKGLEPNYHLKKCKSAIENNMSIRCIFDWDNENELLAELMSNDVSIKNDQCTLYKLTSRAGIEFLSRCGRRRSKHYPKKMMMLGAIYSDKIVAAIAISINRNIKYKDKFNYCILDYGLEWGYEIKGIYKDLLKALCQFIELDDIILDIDSDRIELNDIEELSLNLLEWMSPTIYWSKKNIRIPHSMNTIKTNKLLNEGWLPVEDCGRLIFNIKETC